MMKCFDCGSKSMVVCDCDDVSITVYCEDCGQTFTVEPDGFGHGGLEWVEAMMEMEDY
jgi:transcription elongation factor Elf1